jgi:hypothetical protein
MVQGIRHTVHGLEKENCDSCSFKARFGSFLKHLFRFVLRAVFFRRRRIGFRHFLPKSGEENNPDNPVNPV